MSDAAAGLAARLGVPEVDPTLLLRALTHRSWSAEHVGALHSERLELLGDAVLDLVVTESLHAQDPAAGEGALSRRRARLVRESTLAEVARENGLGAALRLGRGEAASGGADKDSLLADAFEAVVGAVFVSGGYELAATLVRRLLGGRLLGDLDERADDAGVGPIDAKTALQERVAALRLPPPEYRTFQEGPDHAPTFRAEVLVAGEVVGAGEGGSKKAASQAAADHALRAGRLG